MGGTAGNGDEPMDGYGHMDTSRIMNIHYGYGTYIGHEDIYQMQLGINSWAET